MSRLYSRNTGDVSSPPGPKLFVINSLTLSGGDETAHRRLELGLEKLWPSLYVYVTA